MALSQYPPEYHANGKAYRLSEHEPGGLGHGFRCGVADQIAVFGDAVIIVRHWQDDDIVLAGRIESPGHVVEHAELGLLDPAVARQRTIDEQPLGHACVYRHVDVAFEHAAIERIARIAPYEVGPGCLHHLLERPDARPFARAE